ncbi:TetR-like C-terminal domain-containing protein [Streptosporangium sp. NPDC000396]|uniref:TetR-like C-terminal domain-containing protein n=1 Tax=Streptosporangium sp. NPDC000396 TaxID=3366185 RepID=UPI0036BEBD4A
MAPVAGPRRPTVKGRATGLGDLQTDARSRPAEQSLERDVDTGSLRGDLRELAHRLGNIAPADQQLMAGMAHVVLGDPELARIMQAQLADPAGEVVERILSRAADRGEISHENPARAFCHHLLLAAALARPLMEGQRVDEEYLLSFVNAVMLPALENPCTGGGSAG